MKKLVLIPIISLLITMVMVIPVAANPKATLYVDPPSIIDLTMAPPAEFSVNVKIKDVEDLAVFQFGLSYKTTVLTAVNITLGDFFPKDSWVFGNIVNNTAGYARLGAAVSFGVKPGQGQSGSGTLATIYFTVKGSGVSLLFFERETPYPTQTGIAYFRTKLQDSGNNLIPFEMYDGYFANVPQPRVSVDPESIVDPDLVPGKNFRINVKVFNATDLYSYEFFLNYTTTVLNVTEITLGDFFPPDSREVHKEINDTAGYVRYNVTMPSGSTRGENGTGTLATLTFNVKARGESRLDLCKTKLVDSMGNLIEHYEPIDGYFNNKPKFHDIAITQVTTKRYEKTDNRTYAATVSKVNAGERVNITVSVMNNGTEPENFNVTVGYNDTSIETETLTDFQAGTSTILTFEWNTAGVAAGNYTIWAEASGVPGDINSFNDKFTMKGLFMVISGQSWPIELIVVVIIVLIIPVATTVVYFKKIRKPSQSS